MNPLSTWLRRKAAQFFTPIGTGTSAFGTSSYYLLPRTKIDYGREVGDGLGSSVLMSPIKWVQRNFPDAPLEVVRAQGENEEVVLGHELVRIVERPNDFYTGDDLFSGTLFSFIVAGDGYWIKVRGSNRQGSPWWSNVSGPIGALWYVPHWMIEPIGTPEIFITHYNYTVGGEKIPIAPENVVHFRNGIDPRNPRHGLSMIGSELREIFTDDEAGNFAAALLKNNGVPGVVIAPDFSGNVPIQVDTKDLEAMKQYVKQQWGGDNRGEPFVTKAPTKVSSFGFSPQQMDFGDIRNTPEERVCAAIGIPAAVIGFGTGIEQTKVGATAKEYKALAWDGGLIPMQRKMASTLKLQLLPEFEAKPETFEVRFNWRRVSAMQENLKDVMDSMVAGVDAGCVRRSELRRRAGFDVDPTDEVYILDLNKIEIPVGELALPTSATTSPKVVKMLRAKATEREIRILAGARSGTPTRVQRKLIAELTRDAIAQETLFDGELREFFAKVGAAIADAALDVLEGPKARKNAEDELTATSILNRVEIDLLKKELGTIGGAHYLRVAKSTYKLLGSVTGIAVDLPDYRAEEILAIGGRRMGLIDLDDQTKRRLFRELEAGRANGEGPIELARRIREKVPAGRWGNSATRSRVISRTETLHAQRQSTLEAYRDAPNVEEVMVFDNRTGFDDEECSALDGTIVSVAEAFDLMNDEHPNGTRAFAPVVA